MNTAVSLQVDAAEPWPVRPSALAPREVLATATRGDCLRVLQAQLNLVGARAAHAVAAGWNNGRLSYANQDPFPCESELKGLLGGSPDRATSAVTDATRAIVRAGRQVEDAIAAAGVTPFAALARELQLSPLACEIVLVVAAPMLWGELARVYGIAANDPGRPLCDELLVGQILALRAPRDAVARELAPTAALIRYSLVALAGRARPFGALSVDPVVVQLLRAEPLEPEPDEATRVRTADRTLDELALAGTSLREIALRLSRADEGPARIVVRGPRGSGRRTLLAALAAGAGRSLAVIDAGKLPRDPAQRTAALGISMRRAHLRGHLPCVEGLDAELDPASRADIQEAFRSHPGPLALRLAPEAVVPLDPGYVLCELAPIADGARATVWRQAAAAYGIEAAGLDDLAARYRVGPGIVWRVAGAVARRPAIASDRSAELDATLGQHIDARMGQTATRLPRTASFDDLVLPTEVKDSLRELTARVRHRRTVYDAWGLGRMATRGLTALFEGGPGTGKTMAAGVVARELGLEIYRVDLSRVMSKWIGETERNLSEVFAAAEDGHAILLFDEADSLFAKRTEVRSSVDRYANLEVNYLLSRLDSFEGIAILTTNFGTSIDTAFKRRMSLKLTFPFPDEEMRLLLWRVHLPASLPIADDLDLPALAERYQLSGGIIRNVTLRAAFLAAHDGAKVTHAHLERAIKLEYREMGKLGESGVLE